MSECRYVLESSRLENYRRSAREYLFLRIVLSRSIGVYRTDGYRLRLLGARGIGNHDTFSEGGVIELSSKYKRTVLGDLDIKLSHLELTADGPHLSRGCHLELGLGILTHNSDLVLVRRLIVRFAEIEAYDAYDNYARVFLFLCGGVHCVQDGAERIFLA